MILSEITQDTPPHRALRQALDVAAASLREGDTDQRSLLDLINADGGRHLDKKEAAQLVRLLSIAERDETNSAVDPLDAEQAVRIVQGIIARRAAQTLAPPAQAAPLAPVGYAIPRRLDDISGQSTIEAAEPPLKSAPVSPLWHILGATVYTVATVIIFGLGPLALALMGPTWVRWLVWPAGLLTAGLVLRHVWALAARRVEWAVVTALVIGIGVGVGWGYAAEKGWMPPLGYVSGAPVPSLVGNRPNTDVILHIGGRARVEGTLGTGLRVRSLASVNAAEVNKLADGTVVQIMEGPRLADGFTWWRVEAASVTGWVADDWLIALD